MKIEELKEKVLSEIENNLWRLGENGEDSEFIIETKAKTKTGERILVRLNVELFAE